MSLPDALSRRPVAFALLVEMRRHVEGVLMSIRRIRLRKWCNTRELSDHERGDRPGNQAAVSWQIDPSTARRNPDGT